MLLAYLGLAAPFLVDLVATILVLLIAGALFAWVCRASFRYLAGESLVPRVARDLIRVTAEATIAAVRARVRELDLQAQEAEVRRAAREVYRQLPDVVPVPLRGKVYPVPVKLLLTESAFVEVVMGLYQGVDRIHDDLLAYLDEEFEYWKKMGRPGADTPRVG